VISLGALMRAAIAARRMLDEEGMNMEESFSTRKLLSGTELKELNTKSDLAGALQLGSHVGAIMMLGYLHYLAMGSWWVIATGFCLGVTVNFLYAAQHELSHWTVFKTR